jgi:hypothetical protein
VKSKPHASAEKMVGDSDPSARTDVINRTVKGIYANIQRIVNALFSGATLDFTDLTTVTALTGFGARGGHSGLTLSNNAGDATNDIDIAAGFCPSNDAALADVITLQVPALTKQLDAVYAAGTGAGMRLAAEGLADGTWGIWAFHPTSGADDIFASLLANPNPPTGTKKQLLGAIVRSGGAIVGFIQQGNRFDLKVPVSSYNVTNPGTAAVTVTANVPTVWSVEAIMGWFVYGNNPTRGLVTALDTTDTAPSTTLHNVSGDGGAEVRVRTNTSAQFRVRIETSDGGELLRFTTLGWYFRAGSFA